jgi:hypothetical protein
MKRKLFFALFLVLADDVSPEVFGAYGSLLVHLPAQKPCDYAFRLRISGNLSPQKP